MGTHRAADMTLLLMNDYRLAPEAIGYTWKIMDVGWRFGSVGWEASSGIGEIGLASDLDMRGVWIGDWRAAARSLVNHRLWKREAVHYDQMLAHQVLYL